MAEPYQEEASQPLDLQRYVDIAHRRYPHFLIALFLGWLLVWVASWILPARYKSGTLILVEQPTMPKDYVTPNVNEDLQGRLQNITQQILSRTRLLHIIDNLSLYAAGGDRKATPDERVELMRKDIQIDLVRDRQDQITAFKIYYTALEPHLAQRVTSELTKLFINENLEVRQQQSEDTTKFLQSQLETARQSLAEQEAKVREFKGEHLGDLPSQQASNLQILSGMQSQLQNEEDALNTAQQQRVYLQTLIEQYRTLQVVPKTADGSAGTALTGLPAIDQELDKLKSQLASLSSQYTDQYPDIRSLKVQIAKTERLRDQLISELSNRRNAPSPSDASSEGRDIPQDSPMLQLQGQLQANEAEIKNRQLAIDALKAKVSEYQARLNQEPVSEQQLADLTRGYDQSKADYDELVKKESASKMATSMEQMQQGERFRMLDPPSLPLKPDFPKRLQFCGIGLGFGLILGILVVGGLEFMDHRLRSETEIKALLPMKLITEIPEILNSVDEQNRRKKILLGWTMAALVFATILAGSLLSYRHS
jgi:succinoglycan biosynthesis transport protein ExoP